MSDRSPATFYNGRYELRRQIARGGTAQVYLAHDALLDRPVALKVLFPELSADSSFVQRFRREAQAAANLSHPNIVSVYDWGESESTYFIVMEYVDGEALSSIIKTQAPLAPEQTASVGADIAKALSYAHRHGVVHRDVKPGNVLITADGEVKVTDFGIARATGADEQVTQTGLVMGTATYFSPEQAQGLAVDGRSDVYSLGVVLYEMATGKPPFGGETPVAIAYQHVREHPTPPRVLNPAIPPALEAIILQAMAKLPAERYERAEDLRADLDRFARGQTVMARPPGRDDLTRAIDRAPDTIAVPVTGPPPVAVNRRTRRTTPFWAGAAVLLLAAIAAVVVLGGRQLGYFGGGKFLQVPDVEGMSLNKAIAKLDHANLKHQDRIVQADYTKAGEVVTQNPSPPTKVRAGSTILLSIGAKAPKGAIPTVTNLSQSDAEQALQANHFKWHIKYVPATSPSDNQGEVIRQSPKPNAQARLGSFVTLSVVRGSKQVAVPNFTGLNQIQAGAAITKAGLNVGMPTFVFSSSVPANEIVSSDPPSGKKVLQGSAVSLSISEGPGVTIPNLIGDSLDQAEQVLTSLGLNYTVGQSYPTNPGLVGSVAYTNPAQGLQVATGTSVQLRVGRLPTGTTVGNSGNSGTAGNSGNGT
jgi:serine/threonine-protein kinase